MFTRIAVFFATLSIAFAAGPAKSKNGIQVAARRVLALSAFQAAHTISKKPNKKKHDESYQRAWLRVAQHNSAKALSHHYMDNGNFPAAMQMEVIAAQCAQRFQHHAKAGMQQQKECEEEMRRASQASAAQTAGQPQGNTPVLNSEASLSHYSKKSTADK